MAELAPAPSSSSSSSAAPPPPARRPLLTAATALFAVGLVGCDHATKHLAEAALAGGRTVDLVPGVLELRFAANFDTAFSLFRAFGLRAEPGWLAAGAAVALAALVATWIARRRRASAVEHLGFALVAAGAVGNVLDRALRGYVVDFLHPSHWPVFNVADMAVVVGAAVWVLGGWRTRARSPAG